VATTEIAVPDIGDYTDVPVIEVHVAPGDVVAEEDPLVTLESDKATMDVPAPQAGTVRELRVGVGDEVSEGDLLLLLDAAGAAGAPAGGLPAKERVHESAHPTAPGPAGYGSPAGVYERLEVRVPDIGDYRDVPVIEVHVAAGDTIAAEDPLITLESDKATMDVPAPAGGTVTGLRVAVGDTVSEGDVIVQLQTGEEEAAPPAPQEPPAAQAVSAPAAPAPAAAPAGLEADVQAEVLVLGAGPGGYSAAFRAADLGKAVVLVDRSPILGGVCLNVGCIPSKALLHAARVIAETKEMAEHGLAFGEPSVDLDKLRAWKEGVVRRLTNGLAGLANQRKVKVVTGVGAFASPNHLEVTADDGSRTVVGFEQAIIACGSEPVTLPFIPHEDERVIDSTGALELGSVPERLLVVGGGIIGLEMATVYAELGSKITVVELLDQLIPGADKDLVAPLFKRISKQYEAIYLTTKVIEVEAGADGLTVRFEGPRRPRRTGSTRSWWPWGGGPTAARSGPSGPGWRWTSAASSARTSSCAPTCPTSSPSATWSASRCWPTRRSTRATWPPRPPPASAATSTPASSPRWPTPTPRWPGWAPPRTRPRRPGSSTARAPSPGRPAAGRCRWAAPRA
jgi:dihydrolipoamide dehydrogenase